MSYDNPRIDLGMTTVDALTAVSEGNPGAIVACCTLANSASEIDPDSGLGWLGPILQLDTLDIYGSRIWLLFKDVCGQDETKMLAVLRANQLGLLPAAEIERAIDEDPASIDPDKVLADVRAALPNFATEPAAAAD